MRNAKNARGPGAPATASTPGSAPAPGIAGTDARSEPHGTARSPDTLESLCAAVHERVARLEADVRTLQSQNANRA